VKSIPSQAVDFLSLIRRTEIDVRPIGRAVRDHPETAVLGAGILLRLVVYLLDRGYWADEGALSANLTGFAPLDFSSPLTGDQLAPFGFMILERSLAWVIGSSRYAMRFLPLVCGIAALGFYARLARAICSPSAVLVALVLFSFSDDMIYYSSELKPYSLDVALGLALTLGTVEALGRPLSLRRAMALGLVAVAAPWWSFPSAFIVGGCGAVLVAASLHDRRYRDAAVWGTIGLAWLASFVVAYQASLGLLSPDTTMYYFWYFAFLRLWRGPLDGADLPSPTNLLLEVFVNPLNLPAPIWRATVVLPVLCLIAGMFALARRSARQCSILVLPIALAMIAAALKRYPLHGRLMLELVPAFFLLIAQGTDAARALDVTRRKILYKLILILLLAYPCFSAVYEATGKRPREFNRHGDLHNNLFID
jgi:hypothetical protein